MTAHCAILCQVAHCAKCDKIELSGTCSFLFLPSENHMAFYYRSYRRRYGRRRSYPRRSYSYSSRRAAPRVRRRRTTTTKRRSVKPKCECPQTDLDPGQKFLLAQADPFEPRCLGAKVPDSNTVPSVPVCISELFDITTTGAGDARCFAFIPTYSNSIVSAASSGATAWTWAGTFGNAVNWQKRLSFATSFELTRPVAHGIRLTCNNAPTTTTGFVHVAVAFESFRSSTSWPYAVNISEMSGYSWYKRVTLASLTQSPLTVINKYVDETAFRYEDAGSNNVDNAAGLEFHVPWGWGALLVAVEGAATTNPLQVEMILHHESIPKQSGVLLGSTAAVYAPSILGATSRMVANTDFSHTEEQQSSHIANSLAQASQAIQAGASRAGNIAMERVILPAAESLGYNLAGRAISAGLAYVAGRGISGVNSDPNRLALTR